MARVDGGCGLTLHEAPMPGPQFTPPDDDAFAAEPGWRLLTEWPFPTGKPGAFVVGDESQARFRCAYFTDEARAGALHGKVWFGPGAEGPPLHAHGGAICAVLDEVLGTACWASGRRVVAAQLNTSFLKPLPLGEVVRAYGAIVREGTRSITLEGHLYSANGEVYARAEGVFVEMAGETAATMRAAMERR